MPDGFEAKTGTETSNETTDGLRDALGFFTTFLLVFAAVSLFVGTFLILNTFSILVAQRSQEIALYRALGAGRRQVTRSVLTEAFVVGLLGATLGLVLGSASPSCSRLPSLPSASISALVASCSSLERW